jgi:hypothetical protein
VTTPLLRFKLEEFNFCKSSNIIPRYPRIDTLLASVPKVAQIIQLSYEPDFLPLYGSNHVVVSASQ